MLDFITNNISTIIVGLIVLFIVILIIKSMINNKDKSSCGGGCLGCPNACMCHKTNTTHHN